MYIKWCDKREVLRIKTTHEVGMNETGKEDKNSCEKDLTLMVVSVYNKYTEAADKSDMVLSSVKSIRKV